MRASFPSVRVMVAGTLAASYTALTVALGDLSYGVINVRVADALLGVIPILGIPAVIGLFIGNIVSNVASPYGALDLLSPFAFLPGMLLVYKLRNGPVWVGYVVMWLVGATWVSWFLSTVIGLPFIAVAITVYPGIFLGDVVLPLMLLKALKSVLPKRFWLVSGNGGS